ncbi:MAG TPA: FtsW/RodA/SpoVE family cell cycle protein [Clostridia bacterium]|nr:FtsW/RodA/SpoVE family cell cycle protein [Clostridia bacterium]
MNFALLSYYFEPMDYIAIYIGGGLAFAYIISRLVLGKLLKSDKHLMFDMVFNLLSIGLSILYRLSPEYGTRQAYFSAVGILAFFAALVFMKRFEVQYKHRFLLGGAILTLLLITQIWGTEINGSKNWINLYFTNVQPSEFIKLIFVFFMACLLDKELNTWRFIRIAASMLVIIVFFVLQRDMGSAFIFFTVFLVMLFTKDIKGYYTAVSAGAAVGGAFISYFAFSYIKFRVLAWVNPWKYVADKSYQITQSLFAIATGGLIGTGLFLGDPKFIPAVHTDFIFSAICEETGIIGGMLLLSVYALISAVGMEISSKCTKPIYSTAALGLTSLTVIQTLIIVCGVLNIIPITGVTLPFISYGGSSLLSQFINLGMLYYIDRCEIRDTKYEE